ncbi:hypothetical protein QEJ31_05010 [Pigmentibacter sp. JX0631]|uniref:hypothetical protein n=1 Tax=Pigmentibacter sp. JX0631 TaxID=2976982 RepID=UPI002469A06A|nr:hypothetical protein [Pigmentibacter sp. JX0631]WGL60956.1 hypothetical protein QEJ31_05010 [Pigmentibacter sp. JX0631]
MLKRLLGILFCLFSCQVFALTYKNISKNTHTKILYDEGMLLYYAYSYSQAEQNFRMALQFDPSCGPCYLGLAMAKKQQAIELGKSFANLGINEINNAKILIKNKQSFYYAVTIALEKAFSLKEKEDLNSLQKNYIEALKILYGNFQNDPEWNSESLALLVDAIYYYPISSSDNFHCNQQNNENLKKEAVELMQKSFLNRKFKLHPGILHTYIHMQESDINDSHVLMAAKLLPTFHNNYLAHFAHMPNHVYWHRGMYQEAIQANINAIKLDENYFKKNGIGLSSYYYEYHYLHSQHFLTFLGYLTNNFDLALKNAQEIKAKMDLNRMQDIPDYRDIYLTLEHTVLARFEKWDELIKLKKPDGLGNFGNLFYNYTQALAHINQKNEKEYLSYFNEINSIQVSKKIEDDLKNLVLINLNASKMVQNNISFSEIEKYFLENNIKKIEDKYLKNNPPFWYFPSAVLLGKYAEKIKDTNSEEKYKNLFYQLYPNSNFIKLNKKS